MTTKVTKTTVERASKVEPEQPPKLCVERFFRELTEITVRAQGPTSNPELRWQAGVQVDMALAGVPGVLGSGMGRPWIGAYGSSPEAAVRELMAQVGRVFVLAAGAVS